MDVQDADMDDVAGLHWQVAQATSIQNVDFYQSPSTDKHHMGICKFSRLLKKKKKRASFPP